MSLIIYPGKDTVEELPLDQLQDLRQVGFQYGGEAMRDLNKEHIEHLVASNLQGIPPIEVVHTNNGYAILDGYHRVEAAEILGYTSLPARIRSYEDEDAVIDTAFRANFKHGLPASHKDRAAYVLWLNETYEISQTEIAKRAGLSQSRVSRILKRAEEKQDREDLVNSLADTEDEKIYLESQTSHADKLLKAMKDFFESEHALIGSITGKRSETKRAKTLVSLVSPSPEIADIFESLSRSLNHAAMLMRES